MQRTTLQALTLLVLLAGPLLGQQDKVTMKDGKAKTVKVASEDFDGLKVTVEGGSNTLPWKDVDSITYANAVKYQEAVDAFMSGTAADAIAKFTPLAADDKLRAPLRHNVLYYMGQAQQKLGQTADAIATFEKLLKDFPKSRYLIAIGTSLLSLYVEKGDPAGASKALDAALNGAGSAGDMKAGFDFLRGRLLEEQKKYPDAERLFDSVASAAPADSEVGLAAKLALGRCAQRAGRNNDADKRYHEIVAKDAPNEILAGAWNGLADMALEDATKKRDAEGLRVALFDYLRGVVLYVPSGRGTTEEYERALAGSARAFKAVGELDTDAARKKLFLSRGTLRMEQLKTDFPHSRYIDSPQGTAPANKAK